MFSVLIGACVAMALDSVKDSEQWRNTALWGSVAGIILFVAAIAMRLRERLWGWGWLAGLLALHVAGCSAGSY